LYFIIDDLNNVYIPYSRIDQRKFKGEVHEMSRNKYNKLGLSHTKLMLNCASLLLCIQLPLRSSFLEVVFHFYKILQIVFSSYPGDLLLVQMGGWVDGWGGGRAAEENNQD
jgi:hypothetical protein